eukprot:superscaffoldBa00004332_g18690
MRKGFSSDSQSPQRGQSQVATATDSLARQADCCSGGLRLGVGGDYIMADLADGCRPVPAPGHVVRTGQSAQEVTEEGR